ncbi:MAG: hypothetical protein MI784_09955 [Cytophagales bacterium]|nr:hypothetical protein [Cytophagales bacterium]
MSFDKTNDQIALTIPKFRLRHSPDLIGKNEVYIISIAVDEHGLANPRTALNVDVGIKNVFIPNMKRWSWHYFGGDGYLIYGPKNPGSYLSYAILYMESNKKSRNIGREIHEFLSSDKGKDSLETFAGLVTDNIAKFNVVTTALKGVADVLAFFLQNNGDKYLDFNCGTLFRDLADGSEPYHAGEVMHRPPTHFIEDCIAVKPLIQNPTEVYLPVREEVEQ